MRTGIRSTVARSYLLQLSFQLQLSPSSHHHLRVRDATREARIRCGLIQPLRNVLLVVRLLTLRFLLTLLQLLLLAT